MPEKNIYQVREDIETKICDYLEGIETGDKNARVIVTVNPYNELDVMVVSQAFEGQTFDTRNASLWAYLEARLPKTVLDRVNRWDVLTLNEAKKVYPSTLNPKNPLVPVP